MWDGNSARHASELVNEVVAVGMRPCADVFVDRGLFDCWEVLHSWTIL